MAASSLVEQELVAHLFAPVEGPDAAEALRSVRTLWENCRSRLGVTQPIVAAGLTADLPADLANVPEGAVAGGQDPAVEFQVIARREHDVLNVSFAIAPKAPSAKAPSAKAPSGWPEFTRWWRSLGGGPGLLGGAIVYLAKTDDMSAVDLRAAVPAQDDDADRWWETGFSVRGFPAWEVTPTGSYASRRLVVLGRPHQDAELSRLAWSDGGTELPPLGRYLMHAAKLRYLARVRGNEKDLRTADPAAVAESLSLLRQMRRSVEIARANMARALDVPLPADAEFGDWLTEQLGDDTEYLEAAWEHAERLRAIGATPTRQRSPDDHVEHRVGFGVDVVGYSSRSTPQQREVQSRLAGLVERVLADLDVPLHDADRQPAGDGMMVVLPARVPAHVALGKLLRGWRAHVVTDNAAHPDDRIRLRLSVGSGAFTRAAVGFSGQTIIAIGRLLDCEPLRRAVTEHPDADLVAIVTDRTYQDVVGEQYPGLRAAEFEPVEVTVKTYRAPAWLWTGGGP